MAIGRPSFSTGNISDPISALGSSLGSFSQRLLKREDQRARDAEAKEQQEFANKLATDRLAIAQAGESRAAEKARQDNLLGDTFANLSKNRTTTGKVTVPGTQGNEAAVAAANKVNAQVGVRNQGILDAREKYAADLNTAMNRNINTANSRINTSLASLDDNIAKLNQEKMEKEAQGSVLGISPDVSSLDNRINALVAARGRLSAQANDPDLINKAHADAMKEVQGAGSFEKQLLPTSKVPEAVASTPSTSKNIARAMTKKEWAKNAYDTITSTPGLSGSAKLTAINAIGKQADALFGKDPKNAGLTFNQSLKLAKLKSDANKASNTLSDYYQIGVPRNIKTVDGAKAWLTKNNKKTSTGKGGAGLVEATAIDLGIDSEDRPKLTKLLKDYKISAKDLNTLIESVNNADITPRHSGFVTDDVIDVVDRNYSKR